MKYTLDELLKSYHTDKVHRDMLDCHIRLVKLEGKDTVEHIEDLEKEKELYNEKVKIVEDYFKEDTDHISGTGGTAPIRQYITDKEYEVCECLYIRNITSRIEIAKILNINKCYVSTCVSKSMKKIKEIEVNI